MREGPVDRRLGQLLNAHLSQRRSEPAPRRGRPETPHPPVPAPRGSPNVAPPPAEIPFPKLAGASCACVPASLWCLGSSHLRATFVSCRADRLAVPLFAPQAKAAPHAPQQDAFRPSRQVLCREEYVRVPFPLGHPWYARQQSCLGALP